MGLWTRPLERVRRLTQHTQMAQRPCVIVARQSLLEVQAGQDWFRENRGRVGPRRDIQGYTRARPVSLPGRKLDARCLHLNGLFTFVGDTIGPERDQTYKAILGASWGPGLPKRSRLVLLADQYTAESRFKRERNTFGAGIGGRYQKSQRVVLDAGITSELSGPPDRSRVLARAGASIAF